MTPSYAIFAILQLPSPRTCWSPAPSAPGHQEPAPVATAHGNVSRGSCEQQCCPGSALCCQQYQGVHLVSTTVAGPCSSWGTHQTSHGVPDWCYTRPGPRRSSGVCMHACFCGLQSLSTDSHKCARAKCKARQHISWCICVTCAPCRHTMISVPSCVS